MVYEVNGVVVYDDCIDDIMVTALEGGVNYWCEWVKPEGKRLGRYASDQISRGGKLWFCLEEAFDDDETYLYDLTKEKFLYGLELWMRDSNVCPGGILDAGTIDGCDADTIIQYALWGELVFG